MWYVYAGDDCCECGLVRFDSDAFLGAFVDLPSAYDLLGDNLSRIHNESVGAYAVFAGNGEPLRFYQLAYTLRADEHQLIYTHSWRNRYEKYDTIYERVVTVPFTIGLNELSELAQQACAETGASFISAEWFEPSAPPKHRPIIHIEYQGEQLTISVLEDVLTHADAEKLITPLLVERLDQHRKWKLSNAWSTQVGVVGSGRVAPTNTVTINLPYDINGSWQE